MKIIVFTCAILSFVSFSDTAIAAPVTALGTQVSGQDNAENVTKAPVIFQSPVDTTPNGNSIFHLAANSVSFDASLTYQIKKGQKLADITLSPTSVVQLDGDLPSALFKSAGANEKSPPSTGTALYAAGNNSTMYCGKQWGWNRQQSPCFIDADGDGRFELIAPTGFVFADPNALVVTKKGFSGNLIIQEIVVPIPIPYHAVDNTARPQIPGEILWKSDYNKSQPGPVHIAFALGTQSHDQLAQLYSEARTVTFVGQPVEVDLFGMKVTVVGITENGALICHMDGIIKDATASFLIQNITLRWTPY